MISNEVTLLMLQNDETIFKVTNRFPLVHVQETRFFSNKEDALVLFNEWLKE